MDKQQLPDIPVAYRRHTYVCSACGQARVATTAAPAYRLMLTRNTVGFTYADAAGRFTIRRMRGDHAPASRRTTLNPQRRVVDLTICTKCARRIMATAEGK